MFQNAGKLVQVSIIMWDCAFDSNSNVIEILIAIKLLVSDNKTRILSLLWFNQFFPSHQFSKNFIVNKEVRSQVDQLNLCCTTCLIVLSFWSVKVQMISFV
jgi:predicted permease